MPSPRATQTRNRALTRNAETCYTTRHETRSPPPEPSSICLTHQASQKIALMSFFCAILVVIIHVAHVSDQQPSLLAFITRIAVPWFFLISGYFGFRSLQSQGYQALIKNRLRTLAIPFFLINAIWLVGHNLLSSGMALAFGRTDTTNWSLAYILSALGFNLSTPIVSPTWYMRCLFLFLLLMPLFICIMRTKWCARVFVLVSFVFSCAYEYYEMDIFPLHGFNIRGLSFFLLGGLFYLEGRTNPLRPIYALIALPLAVLCDCLSFKIPAIACLIATLWCVIPSVGWSWLRSANFPIYILHRIIHRCLLVALSILGIQESIGILIGLVLLCVAISLLTACILERVAPHFAQLLFGGREKSVHNPDRCSV